MSNRSRLQNTLPFYSAGNWGGWNHHLLGNLGDFHARRLEE